MAGPSNLHTLTALHWQTGTVYLMKENFWGWGFFHKAKLVEVEVLIILFSGPTTFQKNMLNRSRRDLTPYKMQNLPRLIMGRNEIQN